MGGEWRTVRLGDYCEVNPEKRTKLWPHEKMKYIDISSVGEGRLIENIKEIPTTSAPIRAQRLLRNGDILVSTVRPNRRSMIFIKKVSQNQVASTGFAVLRAKSHILNERFLYYLIFSRSFTAYLESKSEGSAYPAVNPIAFEDAIVKIPDLYEQIAIAEILSSLDNKIELNHQMNETLEMIARALFKSWFVDFDPVRAKMIDCESEGLSPEIVTLFPDKLVASALGEIPNGWTVGKVEDIALQNNLSINPSKNSDEMFFHYSLPAYDEGKNPINERGIAIKSNKTIIPEHAVLLSKLNPEIPRVWLTYPSKEYRSICSTEFLVYTPKKQFSSEYLYCYFTEASFRTLLEGMVTGTSKSHQRVQPKAILQLNCLIPSNDILSIFNDQVNNIFKKIDMNRQQSLLLSQIRDLILPKLISGELRVNDI